LFYTWFRWLWIASVVSNIGTWMQNVGAAWLMTDLARSSPLLVALVQTATNLPVFLLGVPAGAAGDLFDRRKLLLVTQGLMLAAAAALGMLTLAHATGPGTLLWLTFALGLGATMNGPTWQAIMPDLVPKTELPAAIGLNSMGFNLARAVGPALGGAVVAAIGAGAAFILNAISFVGVMIVLYLWRREPEHHPQPISTETVWAAMWAGMRYVRFAPPIHSVLLRSGSFIISASALWSLPLVAKVELHRDSTGYGVLLGCLGVGSILGAMLLHRLRQMFSLDTMVTAAVALFGAVNIGLAYLNSYATVSLALIVTGVAWMVVNSTLTTATQTCVPSWVLARSLAVYMLVFQGAMAVGSVIWGAVANSIGLRNTLLCAGVALLVAAAATFRLKLAGLRELDTSPSGHWPEPILVVERHEEHGPVLVTVEYFIEPARAREFALAMQPMRMIRRRDGAVRWGLFEDAATPGRYIETFVVASWAEHLRQHDRVTVSDREIETRAFAFHLGDGPPKVTHWIASE
jgi:MFS family permease